IVTASGVAAPLVSGKTVTLSAANMIGTTTTALPLGSTSVNASAGTGINLRQATGNLNLGSVSSTSGNVTVAATQGNVTITQINDAQGAVQVTAGRGSILSGGLGLFTNVIADSVTLSANGGSIGTTQKPLTLTSTKALSATALTGVSIVSQGPLLIHDVTTTSG